MSLLNRAIVMAFDLNRLLANNTRDHRPVFRYYREVAQLKIKRNVILSMRNRPVALVVVLLLGGIGVAAVSAGWGFRTTDGIDAVREHAAKVQAQLFEYERQLRGRFS